MKSLFTLCLLLIFPVLLFSQNVQEIKNNRREYLWGEGAGTTISRADQEALSNLISQISVFVESQTQGSAKDVQQGDVFYFSESFQAAVSTYSNATLRNTEQIVISDEPNARVFRYIKRAEIDRIFNEREKKILEFARYGEEACREYKAADALRYSYWSLTLLRSHPNGNDIKYTNRDGEEVLLATWLHRKINAIFQDISISLTETKTINNLTRYFLKIDYKDKSAVNFDYSFYNMRSYSGVVSTRNGLGIIEIAGEEQPEKLTLRAEYIFEGESAVDLELRDVMQRLDPIPFRNSIYIIDIIETTKPEAGVAKQDSNPVAPEQLNKPIANRYATISEVTDSAIYAHAVADIAKAIQNKDFASVKSLFTSEGYDIYTRLISYGNPALIYNPEPAYMQAGDDVIARPIPMLFRFPDNNREFVEDVVLHFNSNGLVHNITFALDQKALDDIFGKDLWPVEVRWVLINFLENYKTAFALKRLDYIESIFADDALIIVGRVVERAPNRENPYRNNEVVRYNRYDKTQYIRNLRHAFNSNEFINIRFEDNIINKAGSGGEVFGIQIKQDYFSSNYGDTGYLFLIVNVNEPDTPVIHVRTWQPKKHDDIKIYGLGDF
jgi:hypothetical protein